MLKKLIRLKTKANKLPFWQWLERREKIKRLGNDLEIIIQDLGDLKFLGVSSDLRKLVKIAQEQQQLLQKK